MYMDDYFEGWKYINAVFTLFEEKAKCRIKDSHIVPRYIFRGITKRFFTESTILNDLYQGIVDAADTKSQRNKLYVDENSLLKYARLKIQKHNVSINIGEQIKKNSTSIQHINTEWIYNIIYKNLITQLKKGKLKGEKELSDNSAEVNLLKIIEKTFNYGYVMPEQIRSGASVRLRDTERNYTTSADYLSYTKNLIADFKTSNPNYRDHTDLEILAEIQHKGGASCLVDFSNNFLISLWFATNGHMEDMGYLFCYDVNSDAFIKDNITYLNNSTSGQNIETLLRKTRKISSHLSEDKFRFGLWRPSNINGRIARQDSVFVFGVEKFIISKHSVDVIPIPPEWKKPIIKSLKVFFGITPDSVFPDVDGYATSHSKQTPISENTMYLNPSIKGLDFDIMQKGMSCLIKGNYRIALDYFLRSNNLIQELYKKSDRSRPERKNPNLYKIQLEVVYSIGLCYRKLNYTDLAEDYFAKSVAMCFDILFDVKWDPLDHRMDLDNATFQSIHKVIKADSNLLLNKFYKIIDDYIDALYDTKNYTQGIYVVNVLINMIPSDNIRTKSILQTVYNCLNVLQYLHKPKETKKYTLRLQNLSDSKLSYCKIINECNRVVAEVVKVYKSDMTLKDLNSRKRFVSRVSYLNKMICDYTPTNTIDASLNWIFDDIENEMSEYFKNQEILQYLKGLIVKVKELQFLTQANRIV